MKIIALFFSIYMIVLTLMPCQDRQDHVVPSSDQSSIQKAHAANENNDACSPLCNCNCCSTTRDLQRQNAVKHIPEPVYTVYSAQITPAIQKISISIWQPPQLS